MMQCVHMLRKYFCEIMSAAERKAKWPWNLPAGADRHKILARLKEQVRRSISKRDVSHFISYDAWHCGSSIYFVT